VFGKLDDGSTAHVQISPDGTPGANPACRTGYKDRSSGHGDSLKV